MPLSSRREPVPTLREVRGEAWILMLLKSLKQGKLSHKNLGSF